MSRARLELARAIGQVLKNGLAIMGVEAAEAAVRYARSAGRGRREAVAEAIREVLEPVAFLDGKPLFETPLEANLMAEALGMEAEGAMWRRRAASASSAAWPGRCG